MYNETDIRLATLISSYDLHTSSFSKLIEGITIRDFKHLEKDSSRIEWLIKSQVQLRFDLANWMGIEEEEVQVFQNNQRAQDCIFYFPIESFNEDWKRISPLLRNAIMELTNEDLFVYSEQTSEMKGTFFDLLSYVIQREKKCISMITFWRGILT